MNSIFRAQEKLSHEERQTPQHKLKTLYKMGMNDAAQEENLLRQALSKIQEIRNIRNERRIQVFFLILLKFNQIC